MKNTKRIVIPIGVISVIMVLLAPNIVAAATTSTISPSLSWGSQSLSPTQTNQATIVVKAGGACPTTYSGILTIIQPDGVNKAYYQINSATCGAIITATYPTDFRGAGATTETGVYTAILNGTTTVKGTAFHLTDNFLVSVPCTAVTTTTSTVVSTASVTNTVTSTVVSTTTLAPTTVTATVTQSGPTTTITSTATSTITATQTDEVTTTQIVVPPAITSSTTAIVTSTQTQITTDTETVGGSNGSISIVVITPIKYTTGMSPVDSYLNQTSYTVNPSGGYTFHETIQYEVSSVYDLGGYAAFYVYNDQVPHGTTNVSLVFGTTLTFSNFPTTFTSSFAGATPFTAGTYTGFVSESYP